MTARPPDFEPLASSDPVPGNTDEIATLGRRYTDTADEIAAQARNLRKLASGTIGNWTGKAATVFQSHAADLATRITQAQGRYAAAGRALQGCATPMSEAQQRVYAAVWQAKSAQEQMTANAPAPPRPPGSPPPTAQEKAAAATRSAHYGEASASLAQARRQFNDAVGDYDAAATKAANAINAEINHDGLKDTWWQRNFGWISSAFKIIAIVVLVLAIVSLILICPLTGPAIAALLGMSAAALSTTLTVITIVSVTMMVLSTVFDGIAAGTGMESWTAFKVDLASLATFGLGEGLGAAVKVMADGAEGAGMAVTAGRAGRSFMESKGLPGILYSIGSRLPLAGRFKTLAGAMDAASAARADLSAALKDAEPGFWETMWTMSDDIPKDVAKLEVLDEQVPGVLRIVVPKAIARGAMLVDGAVQWTSFIGGNAYTISQWFTGGDEGQIDQTITQFRQMLAHVP